MENITIEIVEAEDQFEENEELDEIEFAHCGHQCYGGSIF